MQEYYSSFGVKSKKVRYTGETNKQKIQHKEALLAEMLAIIRKKPGIRPTELHKLLHLKHSWNLRSTLIKRGLVRKEKDGGAVRYYSSE